MKIPFWIIFLAFSAFIAISSSLVLVYISGHSPHGLVRADYYQAGLHLDEQRQREAGFDSLHIQLALKDKNDSLIVVATHQGPTADVGKSPGDYKVELFLQRPDDPSADLTIALQASSDSRGLVDHWSASNPHLKKGRWNCRFVLEDKNQPRFENSFAYYQDD